MEVPQKKQILPLQDGRFIPLLLIQYPTSKAVAT